MTKKFLGYKAENADILKIFINQIIDAHVQTRCQKFPDDPKCETYVKYSENSLMLADELTKLLELLKDDIPFYHPRYMAQMIRDPSLASILGYISFLLSNPNNHAYEGGPITTDLEIQVEKQFLNLLNFSKGFGHITGGGTTANLEALWIAREKYGTGGVCFSEASHFAWKRLANVVGCPAFAIPVDEHFRMDLNELENVLKNNSCFFVIANLGSTGTGSVDNLSKILELKNKYQFHLHADAAYGGFYRALCINSKNEINEQSELSPYVTQQMVAIENCDSVTIDPHKHGLVPYGAGAVFYRDSQLRKIILHSAPYTYNLTNKPNIGMYCLEGSRPGAVAAACYLTYKMFPLHKDGIGSVLSGCLQAAHEFTRLLSQIDNFKLLLEPDLDIVCFSLNLPLNITVEELNQKNLNILTRYSVENKDNSFFISKFSLSPQISKKLLGDRSNENLIDTFVMRCVFMKAEPAHDNYKYINAFILSLK